MEVAGLGQSFKARMCGPLWEQLGELRVTCLGDFSNTFSGGVFRIGAREGGRVGIGKVDCFGVVGE